MKLFAIFRMLLLAIAALGYLANGAQAHLKLSGGETLSLMLCSVDSPRTIELHLPTEPAQEEPDTCCGDCAPPAAIAPPNTSALTRSVPRTQTLSQSLPEPVSPRSPLWPGAPPHGPPVSHKQTA